MELKIPVGEKIHTESQRFLVGKLIITLQWWWCKIYDFSWSIWDKDFSESTLFLTPPLPSEVSIGSKDLKFVSGPMTYILAENTSMNQGKPLYAFLIPQHYPTL